MAKTIKVKAAPIPDPAMAGKNRVQKEGNPYAFITELEPEVVELTPYYHRMINGGDLVVVEDEG